MKNVMLMMLLDSKDATRARTPNVVPATHNIGQINRIYDMCMIMLLVDEDKRGRKTEAGNTLPALGYGL